MGKKEVSIVCITGVRIKRVEFGENVKGVFPGTKKLCLLNEVFVFSGCP